MIERILDYPGYLIRFRPEKASDRPILLLHGFPAVRATKNLDLADWLFRHFDRDVYLLHYRGLGESPGNFRFSASIDEATAVAKRLAGGDSPTRNLTVVGHSWGGFVATNVAARLPDRVRALVLLSPFVAPGAPGPSEDWFVEDVRKELPTVFGTQTEAEVRADWDRVKATSLPATVAASLADDLPVGVLQSKPDDVTPASKTKALLPKLPGTPLYRELDLDHSFSQDRRGLARELASMLETLEAR